MKKILFSLFVLVSTAIPSMAAESDAVLDFRNIYWGVPRDSCFRDGKKVEFVKDKMSLFKNAYTIPGDQMNIGAVKCERIVYLFNDENRFYKVHVQGAVDQTEAMRFILTYKFGDPKNRSTVEDTNIFQWLIKDVIFTLKEIAKSRFELTIESNWQAGEDYKKNTSVDDF